MATKAERDALAAIIRQQGLTNGECVKVKGAWYINGKLAIAPPKINLPHRTENQSSSDAVVEGFFKRVK